MRLNGELIIWDHIIEVFKEERRLGWNMCGLTSECVYLDNFSKMRVNLMEKVEPFHIFSIVLFIHVSHKHRSNNYHMSMVPSRRSAGKSITANKVF